MNRNSAMFEICHGKLRFERKTHFGPSKQKSYLVIEQKSKVSLIQARSD